MTVCIAALAEKGKKAVLIADKLVTNSGILPYQIESAADKIIKMTDDVYVMFCGGVSEATIIINEAKKGLNGKHKFVADIAKLINDKHLEYLLEIITRNELITRGINDINRFYTDKNLVLPDDVRKTIDSRLAGNILNNKVFFIVCGKDNNGIYQIYSLDSNPRAMPYLVVVGYQTIGSGQVYAGTSIIQSEYSIDKTIEKVKEITTKAKKDAEKDRDVGQSEDLIILEESPVIPQKKS